MRQETEPAAQARLSKLLGGEVTRQMVREWRRKGYPLEDGEELRRVLLAQRKCPDWLIPPPSEDPATPNSPTKTGPSVGELRYQLLLERVRIAAADATKKELDAQAAKNHWVTAEEAREAGRAIAAIFRSHLLQIPNQWTPILEGLAPGKMRDKMRAEVARILGDVLRLMEERGARPGTVEDLIEDLGAQVAAGSPSKADCRKLTEAMKLASDTLKG